MDTHNAGCPVFAALFAAKVGYSRYARTAFLNPATLSWVRMHNANPPTLAFAFAVACLPLIY